MALTNMIGSKYSKLTVIEEGSIYISATLTTIKRWRCKCDCGKIIEVRQDSLRSGNTRSCGCIARRAYASKRKET